MRRTFPLSSVRALGLLAALTGVPCAAQGTVGVDPVARLFSAAPGQTITQTLNIYNPNPATTPLKVVAYLSDMDISESGETSFLPAGTLRESLKSWITFSPTALDLGGQQTQQLRYTVQVPQNAAPGTHWIMLMLEGQDPQPLPGKTLASFRLRVAHTIYVNVEPLRRAGAISGIFDQAPAGPDGLYTIGVQYSNTGNAATGVQGRVELRAADGTLAATLPLALDVALPGHTLLLRASLSGPFRAGLYSALVVLQDGDNSRDLLGEHALTLPFDLKAQSELPAAPGQGK